MPMSSPLQAVPEVIIASKNKQNPVRLIDCLHLLKPGSDVGKQNRAILAIGLRADVRLRVLLNGIVGLAEKDGWKLRGLTRMTGEPVQLGKAKSLVYSGAGMFRPARQVGRAARE